MPITTTDLTATFKIDASGQLKKAADLSSAVDSVRVGQGAFDAITKSFTFGTGNSQANSWWHDERSILTTANDDLDLSGVLDNLFDSDIAFTAIKWLLIDLDAPDGTKSLRVGPQNVANGWTAPWGGGGATVYQTVHTQMFLISPYGGYAVTAGTGDILRIHNPGASTVTYRIWLGGVAS